MILIINTIERNTIELGFSDKEIELFEYKTENQSNDLLVKIQALLKSHQKSLKDITAIAVNQGPGSFTGVRVGITVANTLAWSLDIPVVGYENDKFSGYENDKFSGHADSELDHVFSKISQKVFSKIVLPYYNN